MGKEQENVAEIVTLSAALSSSKIQESEEGVGKEESRFSSLHFMLYIRMTCLSSAAYSSITGISRGTNSPKSNLAEEDERK